MAKFSAKAIKDELQKKADKAARSSKVTQQVAKKAEETMYKVIKKSVYDSYSPLVYERRGESGGLLDPNNIVAKVSGNHITIENLAEPNESIFGDEITGEPQGLLYDWSDQGLIGKSIIMPWGFNSGKWRKDRMGMTLKILSDKEFSDFIAQAIIDDIVSSNK